MFISVYTETISPNESLEDWEFLGPSLIILLIASFVAWAKDTGKGSAFASIIVLLAAGVLISAFTISSLSNNISVFNVASFIFYIISIYIPITFLAIWFHWILTLLFLIAGTVHCVLKSMRIIMPKLSEERKWLAMYPLFVSFFIFDWVFFFSI